MTVRRTLSLAVVAAVVGLALPSPAWADSHESSDPEQGTRLDTFPDDITIEFETEVAEPATLSILTADGDVIADQVEVELDGQTLHAHVPDVDGSGYFEIAYSATGSDGDPIVGDIEFEVVGPDEAQDEPSSGESDDDGWRGIAVIVIGVALGVAVIVISWRLLRGRPERSELP